MKRIILGILAFTAMTGAASLSAQVSSPTLTADEVVNKYLNALGGRDAIGKVKTMSVEGTMQVMGGHAPT